jgi:hypothetical protein
MAARRWIVVASMIAGSLVPATNAHALWDDRLELFALESVTHDDNVFRISSAVDPKSALGSSSGADTLFTTSLGLGFDVPVSRQRFTGGYTRNYTRYNHFTVLDLDGYEGRALWSWQVGSDLNGELGYAQRLTLASLANVQSGAQSFTPDFLTARQGFFKAAYRLTPRWQVRGEANWMEQSNSATERKVNDIRVDGSEVTVSYVTPAENQLLPAAGCRRSRRMDPVRSLAPEAARGPGHSQLRPGAAAKLRGPDFLRGIRVEADWKADVHRRRAKGHQLNRGSQRRLRRDQADWVVSHMAGDREDQRRGRSGTK